MHNALTLQEANEYMHLDTGFKPKWKKKIKSGDAKKLLDAANSHYEKFWGDCFSNDPNRAKTYTATILVDLLKNVDINSLKYLDRFVDKGAYLPNLYIPNGYPFFPFKKNVVTELFFT